MKAETRRWILEPAPDQVKYQINVPSETKLTQSVIEELVRKARSLQTSDAVTIIKCGFVKIEECEILITCSEVVRA